MTVEAGIHLVIVRPEDEGIIQNAHRLIEERAKEGHVWHRSLDDVRQMVRRGAAAFIDDNGNVKAFSGITDEYFQDDDETKDMVAAEFGAMVTAIGYEGNGYSKDLAREVAIKYLNDPERQQHRSPEFLLFAMAHVGGPGNRVFEKLDLPTLPDSVLPRRAFDGKEYTNYDMTQLRRERPN